MIYSKSFLQPLAHMHPHIRISSFSPAELENVSIKRGRITPFERPEFWLDKAEGLKFFASGRAALRACLLLEGLTSDDEVLIETTTGGPYISSCVTQTIAGVCRWSRELTSKTKMVLVIHEFGFPWKREAFGRYKEMGLIVVEDCAYAAGSRLEGADVGREGDYALYSLPKYFSMPAGGLLAGRKGFLKKKAAGELPAAEAKLFKQILNNSYPLCRKWNALRRENWQFFARALKGLKVVPYFVLGKREVPGVFLAKVPLDFHGAECKKAMNAAGIESTEYYGQGGFYFPVHQFLTEYERQYILEYFKKGQAANG